MANKNPKGDAPKEEVQPIAPIDLGEVAESIAETKEVEVVTHKTLGGEEVVVKQKLVSKQVFEAMTGTFRTVWVKE